MIDTYIDTELSSEEVASAKQILQDIFARFGGAFDLPKQVRLELSANNEEPEGGSARGDIDNGLVVLPYRSMGTIVLSDTERRAMYAHEFMHSIFNMKLAAFLRSYRRRPPDGEQIKILEFLLGQARKKTLKLKSSVKTAREFGIPSQHTETDLVEAERTEKKLELKLAGIKAYQKTALNDELNTLPYSELVCDIAGWIESGDFGALTRIGGPARDGRSNNNPKNWSMEKIHDALGPTRSFVVKRLLLPRKGLIKSQLQILSIVEQCSLEEIALQLSRKAPSYAAKDLDLSVMNDQLIQRIKRKLASITP